MDGRTKRTQRIRDRIKETALRLFSAHGMDRVSMDEIAAGAKVSKVTIYKYFHSKEELQNEVIELYGEKVFTAAEEILNSDLDFLERLKLILAFRVNKPSMASNQHLIDLLKRDAQAEGKINRRLKQVKRRFFEEGQRQGYIDESIPFELIDLHSEIYQAGYEAKLNEVEAVLVNSEAVEKMLDLYFFGLIKRK